MDVRSLAGKTALITGAGGGIGRATALACAKRGARLALCDLNADDLAETEQLLRALGGERHVLAQRVDVANAEQMRAFAEAVHREAPAVDLLVNNAGVGLGGGFLDTSLEDWRWIVDINLLGVVHGCNFFVPAMVARGAGGHVVNVASAAGHLPSELLSAYTTSPMRGVAAQPGARERMIAGYQRRNYGPERVAENILRAVQRGRVVAPITLEVWAAYYAKRAAPWLVRALGRWQARVGIPELA